MAPVNGLEIHKDVADGKLFASRNHNQLRHTYDAPGANRANLDWNVTLRQVRLKKPKNDGAASAPDLQTSLAREGRRTEPLVPEHADGPYHTKKDRPDPETVGRYQNFAGTVHMLNNLNRVSSQQAFGIDWQLNLRDGYHGKPEDKWRRYFTRSQVSFDMMAENCSKENDAYQTSHITPQDRRPDPRTGAISIHTIRQGMKSTGKGNDVFENDEIKNVGVWRHLVEDRRHGHKARKQLREETTMRYQKDDPNGARISESRSDGCIVEMLGKKKWGISRSSEGHQSHEPLAQRAPEGDVRLYHLSRHRILPEADEENREKRKSKMVPRPSPADVKDVTNK